MGRDVEARQFTREDRTRYRHKVRRCLDALARMLSDDRFEVADPRIGVEIEFHLVDENGAPTLRNAEALAAIDRDDFQTELGRFNVEINVEPVRLAGAGLATMADRLRADLNRAEDLAAGVGTHLMMIGILPTLDETHLTTDAFSENPRYHLLSEQVLAARGEDIEILIDGVDRLEMHADSIIPEAACTSTQLHLQVEPERFASVWNAAQAIAGVQVALAANSPFLVGRQLWHETRIALFEQSTDTRSEELKSQGVRPRVWFGERWITSVFDLFEENAKYFSALLPVVEDEDPFEVLAAGGVPTLAELALHNGTIYRWNRPIYDIADGVAHVRVENRLLPAGPTVIDTMANAALFYGLVESLSRSERPIWSRLSFGAAEDNFHAAARHGMGARLYWPGLGDVGVDELVLRELLPQAHAGLASLNVDTEVADELLGVIEHRCLTGRNGSTWLIEAHEAGASMAELSRSYRVLMHGGSPVSTWAPWS